ncbi:MAG: phosphodiester glycosidase family protein [Alphaproteobacteria bacterium]
MATASTLALAAALVVPARAQPAADPLANLLALACAPMAGGAQACTAAAPLWNRDDLALNAVVAAFPAAGFSLRVVPVDARVDMRALFGAGACTDAPAVIIGGYFGRDEGSGPYPLGLTVADSVEASPWLDWRVGGAIVVDADGDTAIRSWRDLDADARAGLAQALQVKPILVSGNANDGIADQSDRWDRVAFGIADDGSLVLVGVFGPAGSGWGTGLTLKQFADYIAAIRLPSGAAIDRAINLDGGPSAHLYLRDGDRFWGALLERYVPNVVCIVVR